jgi:hypothetical protein
MVEPTKNNNPTGKPELDDIFAEEDEITSSTPVVNANQTKASIANRPIVSSTATMDYGNEESDVLDKVKKYLMIGLIVLMAVAVIGGIFWYRQSIFAWVKHFNFFVGKNTPTVVTDQKKSNQNQAVNQATINSTNTNNPALNQPMQTINGEIDSDSDGLADTEEKTLGTDPKKVDTDNDGLFDREEVKVYHTDPLNPDTDGDGHKDGDEVRLHFNPRGTGTLEQMK